MPQNFHLIFGLLVRDPLGCGPLDLLQELWLVPLKVLVVKPHMVCRGGIEIGSQNGIRSEFAKAIKVELTGETAKITVLKVQWKHRLSQIVVRSVRSEESFIPTYTRKLVHILHHKAISILRPTRNLRLTPFYHVIRLAEKHGKLKMLGTRGLQLLLTATGCR